MRLTTSSSHTILLHFTYSQAQERAVWRAATRLELGSRRGLKEALLSLLPVDDVPDGVEVLWKGLQNEKNRRDRERRTSTLTLRYWR